jgi:hypothetical protein
MSLLVTAYGVDSPFCDVNDNWVAVTWSQVNHLLRHSLHAHPRLQRLRPRLQRLHPRLQHLHPRLNFFTQQPKR